MRLGNAPKCKTRKHDRRKKKRREGPKTIENPNQSPITPTATSNKEQNTKTASSDPKENEALLLCTPPIVVDTKPLQSWGITHHKYTMIINITKRNCEVNNPTYASVPPLEIACMLVATAAAALGTAGPERIDGDAP